MSEFVGCADPVSAGGLVFVDVVEGLKFTLEKLGDDGKLVANQSLLAQDAQRWVHDLYSDQMLPNEAYWVPVDEWQAA